MLHIKDWAVTNYMALVKISHTIFALPFALVGFFLAVKWHGASFNPWLLLYVVLCMLFARNAAMAFNRWVDRHIDKKNPRTAKREIPAGSIKAQSALWFVILNALAFVVVTALINRLVLYLSPVALFVVLGYSYTKRFTGLCHFILGLGLSLAPIGAFLSVSAQFKLLPLIYAFVVLFWSSGFDIIYALQDVDFDKKEKLKSIPVWLGIKKALYISAGLHILSAALLILGGYLANFGWFYWIGTTSFITLLVYQHLIITIDDLSRINLAFFTTNGVASLLFALCLILELYL